MAGGKVYTSEMLDSFKTDVQDLLENLNTDLSGHINDMDANIAGKIVLMDGSINTMNTSVGSMVTKLDEVKTLLTNVNNSLANVVSALNVKSSSTLRQTLTHPAISAKALNGNYIVAGVTYTPFLQWVARCNGTVKFTISLTCTTAYSGDGIKYNWQKNDDAVVLLESFSVSKNATVSKTYTFTTPVMENDVFKFMGAMVGTQGGVTTTIGANNLRIYCDVVNISSAGPFMAV